jgi:glyoxylase-like metal-dependent hydrolase (beta-lactamase superfamily II)
MTRAFLDGKTVIWMPKGEDLEAPRKQHNIDPAVYTTFDHQTKTFDLGGGRVLKPLLVRGHSNGCTVYLLRGETMLFTGDALGIGAGRSLRSAAALEVWAEDTQKLVDYLKANLAPYERYALKVYTGHSVENPIPGFLSPNHGRVDIAYLDWRFVQDQASCANAILKGMWLVPDSGLRYMEVVNSQSLRKVSLFTYGIGAVEMPVQEAYAAAGLKMPE